MHIQNLLSSPQPLHLQETSRKLEYKIKPSVLKNVCPLKSLARIMAERLHVEIWMSFKKRNNEARKQCRLKLWPKNAGMNRRNAISRLLDNRSLRQSVAKALHSSPSHTDTKLVQKKISLELENRSRVVSG